MSSGWSNYGYTYLGATVDKYSGVCVLSGLLRGNAKYGHIGTLPSDCRPREGRLVFTLIRGGTNARVDVCIRFFFFFFFFLLSRVFFYFIFF